MVLKPACANLKFVKKIPVLKVCVVKLDLASPTNVKLTETANPKTLILPPSLLSVFKIFLEVAENADLRKKDVPKTNTVTIKTHVLKMFVSQNTENAFISLVVLMAISVLKMFVFQELTEKPTNAVTLFNLVPKILNSSSRTGLNLDLKKENHGSEFVFLKKDAHIVLSTNNVLTEMVVPLIPVKTENANTLQSTMNGAILRKILNQFTIKVLKN